MLQCAVSDADIVTGVVCHASTFLISAGNTATPAYSGMARPLDAVWICTTHEILLVSPHLQLGINGFVFSNRFIGIIAYSYLPDLLLAILVAYLFLNH